MDAIFLLPGVSLYSSCISNAGMAPSSATVGINMYIYTVKGLYMYFPQYHHWFWQLFCKALKFQL